MIKIFKYRHLNYILHGLVWSIVLFFPYLVSDAEHQYKIGPLPGPFFTLSGIVHMIIFYGNAVVLYPKLLKRIYWPVYIVCVIILIFFSYKLKLYILATWFPENLTDARTHVLFPSAIAFIASVFYNITVDKIREEKKRKESETMLLAMELKFLRSQISPHFIFNVLTNLVSLARKKSDNLEGSILMLSSLMRYMLYDTGKKISLQQEVEYLESYIELQKLRFGSYVKIVFTMDFQGDPSNHTIETMLLIPFVENAFKHGVSYIDHPFIRIDLAVKDGLLDLKAANKFNNEMDKSKDDSSGIGLSNVRSRLRLVYPDKHQLLIHSEANLFSIHLTLKLSS